MGWFMKTHYPLNLIRSELVKAGDPMKHKRIDEPTLGGSFNSYYGQLEKMTLYVPAESVEIYKTTSEWSEFGTILPIDE